VAVPVASDDRGPSPAMRCATTCQAKSTSNNVGSSPHAQETTVATPPTRRSATASPAGGLPAFFLVSALAQAWDYGDTPRHYLNAFLLIPRLFVPSCSGASRRPEGAPPPRATKCGRPEGTPDQFRGGRSSAKAGSSASVASRSAKLATRSSTCRTAHKPRRRAPARWGPDARNAASRGPPSRAVPETGFSGGHIAPPR